MWKHGLYFGSWWLQRAHIYPGAYPSVLSEVPFVIIRSESCICKSVLITLGWNFSNVTVKCKVQFGLVTFIFVAQLMKHPKNHAIAVWSSSKKGRTGCNTKNPWLLLINVTESNICYLPMLVFATCSIRCRDVSTIMAKLIGCSWEVIRGPRDLTRSPWFKSYSKNIRMGKCSQQCCYVWFHEDLFSVVPFHALILSLSVICWLQGSQLCKVKNLLYNVPFTLWSFLVKLVFNSLASVEHDLLLEMKKVHHQGLIIIKIFNCL